ncbi:MAG: 2-oxoacid:acceptor oxidoreductase family protein [Deltaproteobacteria bacterium]|nr:2-oxoacid:acceptor oxidoreductase family protein [Deltaproteobacteria bacterium]
MIDCRLLIAGLGGQGVVFLSRLISQAALLNGDSFITYESHGMAMRGGSVTSQVKIGNYRSPLIGLGQANLLLVLAAPEYLRNRHLLQENGQALINSPPAAWLLPAADCCAATEIALRNGLPQAANLVFAGWLAGHPAFPYDFTLLCETLKSMAFPPALEAANLKALALGRQSGDKSAAPDR